MGEPALGVEGFGGDDARTSIFDYWSMPEFTKWVNKGKFDGGLLSDEQKRLRDWYAALLAVMREPAFTRGDFYGLNHANNDNPGFGRVGGETASGHWLYAFLRRDPGTGQVFLVIANFHPGETLRQQIRRLETTPPFAIRLLEYHYRVQYHHFGPDARTERALERDIRAWQRERETRYSGE